MSKKYIVSILAVFCLFFFLSGALFIPGEKDIKMRPRLGGTLRVKSFVSTFRTQLDPASPDSYIFVSEQLYDGLVKLDEYLKIVPSLAEYWRISSDGLKYTFFLRRGINFHHGGELTAEDVKFSLERIIDKKTDTPYYQFFTTRVVGAQDFREERSSEVAGFIVRDKYVFEIRLIKPYVPTLYLMSMHFCKILPKDNLLSRGRGFFSQPSGTGPFKFAYWIRGPQLDILGVRLERNEDYFRGRPYLEAIEFSPHYTLDHFFDKEIDIIPILSERLLSTDCQVFEGGSFNLAFLGMSCHIPPLDQKIIRKAIFHGLNKREVLLAGFDIRYMPMTTKSFIPAKLHGFFPVDDEEGYVPEKAKEMLQQAGFTDEHRFPTLTLFMESPRAEVKFRVYRELRRKLDALGIRLRMRYFRDLEEIKRFERPYLVFMERNMNFPDPEDIIRPLFFSNSIFNVFGYSNPELDRLLEETDSERSWTRRIKLFHRIEQSLFSDVPAIPLFSNQQRIAVQPYVRGVKVHPLGFYYLETRKIWFEKNIVR
ncbi:MAG: hypothetical protein GTO17_08030 [Candidatus Aminicenantes bacterium]|nr:hypothetical protein [Candidatus Aminicenantes bacterium]